MPNQWFVSMEKPKNDPKWPQMTKIVYFYATIPYLTLILDFKGGKRFEVLSWEAFLGLKWEIGDFLTLVKRSKMGLDGAKLKKSPSKYMYPLFLPKLRGVLTWNFFDTTTQKKVGNSESNFEFSPCMVILSHLKACTKPYMSNY